MQILQQKEYALAGIAKLLSVLFSVGMNIAMAQFVIEIAQTVFDVIDLVGARRIREMIGQTAEDIFCRMRKLTI